MARAVQTGQAERNVFPEEVVMRIPFWTKLVALFVLALIASLLSGCAEPYVYTVTKAKRRCGDDQCLTCEPRE